jgi:ribose transport system ATP-binding protein
MSKTFAGRTVLSGFDIDVLPGEIHGLLGQNGAGKSTFIKIIAGYYAPDPGSHLSVGGCEVRLPVEPRTHKRLGLSFVHQDLGLAPQLTVLENLRIGRFERRWGWRIPWRDERAAARHLLARFGLAGISPDAAVDRLPAVDRAMIAILRGLDHLQQCDGGLLVLDEPTAYLPRDGVDRLFEAVRDVAASGIGVLFVSHRLEEVFQVTDRVTILRDGCLVETCETRTLTEQGLITRILGRSLGELYPDQQQRPPRETIMSVNGLSTAALGNVSLELSKGEIVGLTGLLGMGHEAVPYGLFGTGGALSGSLTLRGETYDLKELSPRKALAAGLALLPGNRLRDGAALGASVAENVTLPTLASYFSGGVLHRRREHDRVRQLLETFAVKPAQPGRPFSNLSGGNQQKSLLAKWFDTRPAVMIMHEPTQGVDVGARREIFRHIRNLADQGTALLIASSEYEDLANICDRVIVFRGGAMVSELSGPALTSERLIERCYLSGVAGLDRSA